MDSDKECKVPPPSGEYHKKLPLNLFTFWHFKVELPVCRFFVWVLVVPVVCARAYIEQACTWLLSLAPTWVDMNVLTTNEVHACSYDDQVPLINIWQFCQRSLSVWKPGKKDGVQGYLEIWQAQRNGFRDRQFGKKENRLNQIKQKD